MHINISYEQEFYDLIVYLKSKYSKKLFDLSGIGRQLDLSELSKEFFTNKTSVSDISVDPNSNVDDRSVISYDREVSKPIFLFNSYYVLWKKMKQLYGFEKANKVIENQLTGDIYINDFTGFATLSYCYNYSTFDIALMGLPMITKIKSVQPKYLYSFKSQMEQFITIAANSTLGATGISDLFITMSAFVKRSLDTLSDAGFNFKEKEDVWKYVKENLVSFIYTINQPMRSASQSPFTNVSIMDDNFLDTLIPDYKWYVGNEEYKADKEIVKKLQVMFLDIMNHELERTPVTFPISTACFSIDDNNDIMDEEFLDMVSEKNMKYGFINIYAGKTSTLSSCCFFGEEFIKVYSKEIKSFLLMSIKAFVDIYTKENNNSGEKIDSAFQIESLNPNTLKMEMTDITGVLRKKNEYKKLIHINYDGRLNRVTPDHKYFVKDKKTEEMVKVRADFLLKNKDKYLLLIIENENRYETINEKTILSFAPIDSIKEFYHDGDVFDIELKDNHYFSADRIISHNCRLRSDIEKAQLYTNNFGAGSTKIGSQNVTTINLPRLAFKYSSNQEKFFEELEELAIDAQSINNCKRHILKKRIDAGNHPLYSLGFINLNSQYSTIGLNGFHECLEIMGYDIKTEEGQEFGIRILDLLNDINDQMDKKYSAPHNLEQIPAENVSIKLADKDRLLRYNNVYDIYSNQFIPLTKDANLLDRISLQGIFDNHFSGGAICHLNVDQEIENPKMIKNLIVSAAKQGVVYFAINFVLQLCDNGHMNVSNSHTCITCGSENLESYTRIVGYLTSVKSWNKKRRELDFPNRQFYKNGNFSTFEKDGSLAA